VEREEHRQIDLGDGPSFRVVVVADTHSRPHPKALGLVAARAPDLILHAGDIGALSVLDPLASIAPLVAVRGNIDSADNALPDVVHLELVVGGAIRACWMLTHIAVRGPRLLGAVARRAQAHGAQMVVCGHSHVPFISHDRGVAVFNPGSIGPRRFRLPITFGVIDATPTGVSLTHWSCETGAPWRPS
jgi:putative phosphoesterase